MEASRPTPQRGWLRRSIDQLRGRIATNPSRPAPESATQGAPQGIDSPLLRARIADESRRLALELDALQRAGADAATIARAREALLALRLELCGVH